MHIKLKQSTLGTLDENLNWILWKPLERRVQKHRYRSLHLL